jgi:NAD(P)H-hydrate epimerase
MATAGSGDVLTGMLLGLLAQGIAPYQAAVTAVYLHGQAGDRALAAFSLGQTGISAESYTAADLIRFL